MENKLISGSEGVLEENRSGGRGDVWRKQCVQRPWGNKELGVVEKQPEG